MVDDGWRMAMGDGRWVGGWLRFTLATKLEQVGGRVRNEHVEGKDGFRKCQLVQVLKSF